MKASDGDYIIKGLKGEYYPYQTGYISNEVWGVNITTITATVLLTLDNLQTTLQPASKEDWNKLHEILITLWP